jgi:hypothetical protein
MQANSQKYGHFIAAGGMVLALISFFLIPFMTMTLTVPNLNPLAPQSSTVQSSSETFSALQSASFQGFVWLDALLAAGILLLALLLAFSHNPFGTSRIPLNKQIQWGIYAIIGASVLSLLVQFFVMRTVPGSFVSMYTFSSNSQNSAIQTFENETSMSYAAGSWIYLVGMLAAIGGAIYAFMSTRSTAVAPGQIPTPYMQPPVSSPYMQPPASPYMMPPTQQSIPPTQQSAPPAWQQPNQPPSQYPPQAAPEQYPPSSQPWLQTPPPPQPPPQQPAPNQQPWQQPQQPPQPPTEYR